MQHMLAVLVSADVVVVKVCLLVSIDCVVSFGWCGCQSFRNKI